MALNNAPERKSSSKCGVLGDVITTRNLLILDGVELNNAPERKSSGKCCVLGDVITAQVLK